MNREQLLAQKTQIKAIAAIAIGLIAFMAISRVFHRHASPRLSRFVSQKLPLTKHLRTIPDDAGNYDIDGVSFDSEGVVVSGDQNKNFVI